MRVGFTTGTFDMIHRGHIETLKGIKQLLGDKSLLIIGLTTDDLGAKQKRVPVMSYQTRRDILIEFPFVDMVIENNEKSNKSVIIEKLPTITDIFIGEEYFGSEEYKNLEDVKVHFLPPSEDHDIYSSSHMMKQMLLRQARNFSILKESVCGGVFKMNTPPLPIVIKTVPISQREFEGDRGANVYFMGVPNPRNWYGKKVVTNLPGVNGYRELDIVPFVQDFSWCTILDTKLAFERDAKGTLVEPKDDWSHLKAEKSSPKQVHFIYQEYKGPTLREWAEDHKGDTDFKIQLEHIVKQVEEIIVKDLIPNGIVHMDIHADNVLIGYKKSSAVGMQGSKVPQVYLIDFGWCLHRSFELDDKERKYLKECLQNKFDLEFFRKSMSLLK